jgi:metal-responsive CopG/Arc/MetJ family transcriptional regulator
LIYFIDMKSILLKLDDSLFEETDKQVKAGHTSRSNYIKMAIEHYNKWLKQRSVEEQIIKEVALLKKDDPDKDLKQAFDTASMQDLKRHLND